MALAAIDGQDASTPNGGNSGGNRVSATTGNAGKAAQAIVAVAVADVNECVASDGSNSNGGWRAANGGTGSTRGNSTDPSGSQEAKRHVEMLQPGQQQGASGGAQHRRRIM